MATKLLFPTILSLRSYCKGGVSHSSLNTINIGYSSIDFITKLIAVDPEERLTAIMALQGKWLRSRIKDTVNGLNLKRDQGRAQDKKEKEAPPPPVLMWSVGRYSKNKR